jgi:RNA-directed DNA polymerase
MLAADRDCRRNKATTPAAIAWERDQAVNLSELHAELLEGSYTPGPSICFVITWPKPREVWAAGYRDRVVHHLLHRRIGPRFERAFIADSCACLEGRGTLYAGRRLEAKVRAITANWTRPAWYLKCDVASFFPSIDKRILGALLERRIHEPFWRALALQVLFHDPRPGADVRGDPAKLALILPEKSLFNRPAHLGLPIGNLSSQFGANVYLNELDQLVKHRLGVRHYIRYVDDFVLLHESPQQLNAWRAEIEAFLAARLGLKLAAAKTVLQPIERGIDFAGHVIKPALRRLEAMPRADVYAAANSYLGLARQATHSHHPHARPDPRARGRPEPTPPAAHRAPQARLLARALNVKGGVDLERALPGGLRGRLAAGRREGAILPRPDCPCRSGGRRREAQARARAGRPLLLHPGPRGAPRQDRPPEAEVDRAHPGR